MNARLRELNVELIQVDYTDLFDPNVTTELKRTDRSNIPINLIYPPNYPQEPAIMLPELFGPAEALKVLERMEKIQSQLPSGTAP